MWWLLSTLLNTSREVFALYTGKIGSTFVKSCSSCFTRWFLALFVTQLSEAGWAEDNPPTTTTTTTLSFSLHPSYAAMILQRAFSPSSCDQSSCRRMQGSKALLIQLEFAQPSLNHQQQQQPSPVLSFPLFSTNYISQSIYLRTWQHANWFTRRRDHPSPLFKSQFHKEETKQICAFVSQTMCSKKRI